MITPVLARTVEGNQLLLMYSKMTDLQFVLRFAQLFGQLTDVRRLAQGLALLDVELALQFHHLEHRRAVGEK